MAGPLRDNSFLTHLATGRIIWSGEGIPRSDPYTFTAAGEPWVVQSWFASVIYGGIDRLAGFSGLRVLFSLTGGLLAWLGWLLTRSARDVAPRLLVVVPFLLIGFGEWTGRPLLMALALLALVLLAAESALDPRWLVPVGWGWLNVHGSWPLGLVALGCLALGSRLDRRPFAQEVRALQWLTLGFALGSLNPYGPKLLSFPVVAFSRREAFRGVVEWQPPRFDEPGQLALLAMIALGIVGLARRPSHRAAIVLVVFSFAAFLSARNVAVAGFALLPGTAASWRGVAPGVAFRNTSATFAGGLGAALLLLGVVTVTSSEDFDEGPYPVAAHEWLVTHDLAPPDTRIVSHDYVGNWLESVYGPEANVFIDDRVEILPTAVVADYRALLRGSSGWEERLDRYGAEAILWESDRALAELLRLSASWRVVFDADGFLVAVPNER